jgi:serine/threonine protein kinase
VAIKEFSPTSITYSAREFRKEISLLSVVQHPNVCKFYGAFEVQEAEEMEESLKDNPMLVMEMFDRGSLADCLDPKKIAVRFF